VRTAPSSVFVWALGALVLVACGGAASERRPGPPPGSVEEGMASWYGGSLNGGPTASGERFNQDDLTAAHRTLPFGARVRVTNQKNQRQVTVRINDRGPFSRGRVIDLSRAAARLLGMIDDGVVPVLVEVLTLPPRRAP
jgi:rare lipoprotein A